MPFQTLRGTTDLLAHDLTSWRRLESSALQIAQRYGYQELRTPVMEDAALFLRSVGETTDIVQKEMFRFTDRGGHDIVLRPEGTAPVVRAYLQHHLHKTEGFAKLFYLGPMFRAERPQAGRLRQFHQFGAEAIGSVSPWVDVEIITLCVHTLLESGVADATVWLASMGCRDDQARGAQHLKDRLAPHRATLCEDCQNRFDRNIFRVLDCKQPGCHALAQDAVNSLERQPGLPPTPFALCEACVAHFDTVRHGLNTAGIAFDDAHVFARGLDYYTRTVFEVRSPRLGAQDAVAAGGRYDHLVEEFGGPSLGACGFAAGIERVLLAARPVDPVPVATARAGVYVAIPPKSNVMSEAFRLAQRLRQQGTRTTMDYDGRSLKAQFREADQLHCQVVAILGEQEVNAGSVTMKDLAGGEQRTLPLDDFMKAVAA
ncbi:MAG: histidine--tRNA ligase [Candidatus Omnitrophica bacterium]|nr:histidine--tRNA ligase [Candidatus Omnitrophota bacterium]